MSQGVATLAATAEHHDVAGFCPRCRHHGLLDMVALRARLGDGFPLPDLRPLLRCTRCGHRGWSDGVGPVGGHLLEPCSLIVQPRGPTHIAGPLYRGGSV